MCIARRKEAEAPLKKIESFEVRKGSETFLVEILEDGTVKSTPPRPDGNAEKFMATLARLTAVPRKPGRHRRPQARRS